MAGSGTRANVVIAGGGVAALEAALALRELAPDLVHVELLAPEPAFWYRPLAVAEPFRLGEVRHFDLSHLALEIGATFSPGALVSVDASRRIAHTAAGSSVPYSMLLLACGAVPRPAVEGALTFRGPADTARLEQVLAELEAGEITRVAYAVPAGTAWSLPAYELALLTAAWVDARGLDGVELALVTPERAPLELFGREASESMRTLLAERDVVVASGGLCGAGARGRARALRRRRRPGRPCDRPPAPPGAADRRCPADVRGVRPRRPPRTRHSDGRRLRRRRHHDVPGQAGRSRLATGRRSRRGDRRRGRRGRCAASFHTRFCGASC